MSPCPSREALEAVAGGTLSSEQAASIRSHLEICAACRGLLDAISDDAEMVAWVAEAARPESLPEEGPHFRALLGALASRPALEPWPESREEVAISLEPSRRPGDLGSLGDCSIQAELGRGATGIVFRGYDETLCRQVAIKMLRPELTNEKTRQRLLQEAQAAARFRHDNTVVVHAVANPPGKPPYLVMEYIDGAALSERIRQAPRLDPAETATIVEQVATGLAAAHAAGLIHRDIKPGNILLERSGGRARITDFGLARVIDEASGLTMDGVAAGTPAYMSPEQASGSRELDSRTDIYSLGVTFYEALTGDVPFRGSPQMVLKHVREEEPRPPRQLNERIPRDLETICLKAMNKDPSRRYQTAGEMADDLSRWRRGEPILARPTRLPERLVRWCRRNPLIAGLSAALVIAIVVGFAGVLFEWRQARLEAAEASRHRARAEEPLQENLAVVNHYFTQVSENRLLNEPGLQSLRKELLGEARDYYERFVRESEGDPRIRTQYGAALFRLANITAALDSPPKAIALMERAVQVAKELWNENPDDRARKLALGHAEMDLGVFYEHANRLTDAEAAYEQVLQLLKRDPGEADDDDRRILRIRTLINVSKTHALQGRMSQEEKELKEATTQSRELGARGVRLVETRNLLGICTNNLGDLYRGLGRNREARQALEEAVRVRESLARTDPRVGQYQCDLGQSLLNLAGVELTEGKPQAAEATCRNALAEIEPVAEKNSLVLNYQEMLSAGYSSIGVCEYVQGNLNASRPSFERALAIRRRLASDYPDAVWLVGAAAQSEGAIGQLLMDLGETDAALAAFDRSLDPWRKVAKGDRSNVAGRVGLAQTAPLRLVALFESGRYADFISGCEQQRDILPPSLGKTVGLLTAMAKARLEGKNRPVPLQSYREVAAELQPLIVSGNLSGAGSYLTALCLGCCNAAASAETKQQADSRKFAEKTAQQAILCLRRAQGLGFFRIPRRREAVRRDPELAPLRQRPDFRKLLQQVEQQSKSANTR
jgi:tetratricopeptide (TPR) repeat protein/tRNA A-37 threonylcarbamoyl transferase component Bud32